MCRLWRIVCRGNGARPRAGMPIPSRIERRMGALGAPPLGSRWRDGGDVLTLRIIPCLDVRDGRVVKGVRFANLRDAGTPETLAARYEQEGADELVVLDVSATPEGRAASL